ncbi:unnamed protein product, partial [Ectocarpus fasciculatus]
IKYSLAHAYQSITMSQSRVNLATAKRELAERRDEANLCMVELKHAQEVLAAGGTGPKVLSVTVQEIFGPITVDRVAVRPDASPAQEKVVAQGIPCTFPLDAAVESFDLVLMAENDSGAGATKSAAVNQGSASREDASELAEAAVAPAVAGDGHEADEVVISAEDAAEAVEAEAAAAATVAVPDGADPGEAGVEEVAAAAAAAAAAAGAVSEQGNGAEEEECHDASGPAAAPVAVDAAEAPVAGEMEAVVAEAGQGEAAEAEPAGVLEGAKEAADEASPVSGTTGEESNADVVVDDAAPASAAAAAAAAAAGEEEVASAAVETPAAESDVPAAAEVAVTPVDGDGDSPAAGLSLDTAAAAAEAAAAAAAAAAAGPVAGEGSETAQAAMVAEVAGEAADTGAAGASLNGGVTAASPAAAAALGCSTGTTEVVVPSSELDFKLSQGQWRYLEADSTPVHGDGAVEVTKGIRFSTSLKAVDSREDDDRIVELSEKLSDAERRVRAAEAMVKKVPPAAAAAGGRAEPG